MGETEGFVWDYSEGSDIFNIHKKGKKSAGSSELGDFTVDFDNSGNIIGVEIMNVADFLRESDISEEELQQLQGAELCTSYPKNGITYLWVKLLFPEQMEKKIAIPAPVVAEAAG